MSALPLKADMLRAGIDVCYVPIADIADATPQSKGLGKLSDSAVIVEPPEHPEEPALVMPEARSEATGHDRAAQTLSYS